MTTPADGLRLSRCADRLIPALGQLALRGQDGKAAAMVALQPATDDRREYEHKPPVVADEVSDGVHAVYLHASAWGGQTSARNAELAVPRAAEKRVPLGPGEDQRRAVGLT